MGSTLAKSVDRDGGWPTEGDLCVLFRNILSAKLAFRAKNLKVGFSKLDRMEKVVRLQLRRCVKARLS